MQHIPNLLTLSNLFCGCCALMFTLNQEPVIAAWFVLGCFIFDYADGMTARALGITSPLGKQLDSLADVISFGVVPGAMLHQLLVAGGACKLMEDVPDGFLPAGWSYHTCLAALPAFVLAMFAAMRLGRFNIDPRQTRHFVGLSTPACAVFVLGLALAAYHDRFGLREIIRNQWLIYGLIALLSWLMNSNIPMFGMKIKSFDMRSNAFSLVFLAVFLLLVFFLKELALSAVIVFYVLSSVVLKNKVLST
ncbi:MAG: CDP-alcohol phosphatidyltransferase family protein [Saprospiraceae bacterium]|nr:CDP-alcohol phosphatidyltransferase family protein [Saprospiraceae bacterium]